MKRKSLTPSPLGAVFSLATSYVYPLLASHLPLHMLWLLLVLGIFHIGTFYLLVSRFPHTLFGEFSRGAIIGLNAGWNGCLMYLLSGSYLLAGLVCLIPLLSSHLAISRKAFYHTLLGWCNWILPMSWAVNIPGLIIFLLNVLLAPIGYLHPLLRGITIRFHWNAHCSTLTLYGGLIRPIKGFAGLNMGNFIFINPGWQHLLRHEIGHLFSLAAMGSIFHYIGGVDENFLQKHYWKAFAEYLAESYSESEDSVWSMWS